MINRKIAISAVSIFAAFALVAGGTFAYFSDTGTSTNNTFSTGNVDLRLGNGVAATSENVTASFGGTNLVPGQCLSPAILNLRNAGTVAANHVDITPVNDNNALAQYLRIDSLDYGATNVLSALSAGAGNGNAIKDLQDLAASSVLINLPLADTGVDHALSMTVCLDESAPNGVQGVSNILDLTILLDQGLHI